jgi:predicted nucleic acid-binding protein
MEIILDASAIMAVIVKEPERDLVIQLTQDAAIFSPDMVSYEIANGLTKMMKKKLIEKERMVNAFNYFEQIPIKKINNPALEGRGMLFSRGNCTQGFNTF